MLQALEASPKHNGHLACFGSFTVSGYGKAAETTFVMLIQGMNYFDEELQAIGLTAQVHERDEIAANPYHLYASH